MLILIAAVAADFTRDLTIRLDVDDAATDMRWSERLEAAKQWSAS